MGHIENAVCIVIVQYLNRCIESGVCLYAYCIATVVLVALLEVCA
jgi:hypothetical protein